MKALAAVTRCPLILFESPLDRLSPRAEVNLAWPLWQSRRDRATYGGWVCVCVCAYARVCAKPKVTVRQIDGPQLGDKVIMREVKCE